MKVKEIKWITGLKGCCCISVVLLHLLACLFEPAHNAAYEYLPLTGMYNFIQLTPINIIFNGSFAVYIFWTVSAFLLARSYNKNPDTKMLARKNITKFFRVMIPVAIVSIIAFILLKNGLYFHIQAGELVENSFWINERDYTDFALKELIIEILWGDWLGTSMMIPPLWTIRYEFIGSILVSMLLATEQGKNKRFLSLIIILLLGTNRAVYICFILGMFLASVYEKEEESKLGIVYFVLGIIMGAYPPTGIPASGMYRAIYDVLIKNINWLFNKNTGVHLWYVISAFLILLGIIKSNLLKKAFSVRPLHFCGNVSMYVYICHIPVIWSVSAFIFFKMYTMNINIFMSAFVCSMVGILVTFICAFLLKKLDDLFMNKKIRQLTQKLLNTGRVE